MQHISLSEFENNLHDILKQVTREHTIVEITCASEQTSILMDSQTYHGMLETLYLLHSQANAKRLYEGIEQHRQGKIKAIDVTAYLD